MSRIRPKQPPARVPQLRAGAAHGGRLVPATPDPAVDRKALRMEERIRPDVDLLGRLVPLDSYVVNDARANESFVFGVDCFTTAFADGQTAAAGKLTDQNPHRRRCYLSTPVVGLYTTDRLLLAAPLLVDALQNAVKAFNCREKRSE